MVANEEACTQSLAARGEQAESAHIELQPLERPLQKLLYLSTQSLLSRRRRGAPAVKYPLWRSTCVFTGCWVRSRAGAACAAAGFSTRKLLIWLRTCGSPHGKRDRLRRCGRCAPVSIVRGISSAGADVPAFGGVRQVRLTRALAYRGHCRTRR